MDKYRVASIGSYIILLNPADKTVLFSKRLYFTNKIGEITIEGKRYVVFINSNILVHRPLEDFSLENDFTNKAPFGFRIIPRCNRPNVYMKIDDCRYITIQRNHDYFVYSITGYVYIGCTYDYCELYDVKILTIGSDANFNRYFKMLPECQPYLDGFDFTKYSEIGLCAVRIDGRLLYPSGENLKYGDMYNDADTPIINGPQSSRYYLGLEGKNIVLTNIDTDEKRLMTYGINRAARYSGFSDLYKFPDYFMIICGENKFSNMIVTSGDSYGLVELYSTTKPDGNDVGFSIVNNEIYCFKIEYLMPKKTKSAR